MSGTIDNTDLKPFKAIVIGGSAGSFPVVNAILENLPECKWTPVILCLHRLKSIRHGFQETLELKSKWKVIEPNDKDRIRGNTVYLAPANYHLLIDHNYQFALSTEEQVNHSRPSIDLTFDSASYFYRNKLLGILLSGANKDGAWGLKRIQQRGGITMVQDPVEASINTMPKAAIQTLQVDHILPSTQIIEYIQKGIRQSEMILSP